MKNEKMDKAVEKAINDLSICEDDEMRIIILERLYIQGKKDQIDETIKNL